MLSKVHLIFILENNDVLLFKRKEQNGYSFLHTKCTSDDTYSNTICGSRIIIDKLNELDLRQLSICTREIENKVDFCSYQSANQQQYSTAKEDVKKFFRYSRHPQRYLWSHYLNQAPLWNDDKEANFYYFIQIKEVDLKVIQAQSPFQRLPFKELVIPIQNLNQKHKDLFLQIAQVIENKDYLRKDGKTILYFNFKYEQSDRFYGMRAYLDTVSIYNGIYRRKYDDWRVYAVVKMDFPTEEILKTTHAIVMPGSGSSVYERTDWVVRLLQFLNNTYKAFPNIRFLSICFGLQAISQALGGKVTHTGTFISGNCQLQFNKENFKQLKIFKDLQFKPMTIVNQVHGDEIVKTPDYFIHLAQSDSCYNEVLISKDERIFGFQGHPEYSSSYQLRFVGEYSISNNYSVEQFLKKAQHLSQQNDPYNLLLCKVFLRG